MIVLLWFLLGIKVYLFYSIILYFSPFRVKADKVKQKYYEFWKQPFVETMIDEFFGNDLSLIVKQYLGFINTNTQINSDKNKNMDKDMKNEQNVIVVSNDNYSEITGMNSKQYEKHVTSLIHFALIENNKNKKISNDSNDNDNQKNQKNRICKYYIYDFEK